MNTATILAAFLFAINLAAFLTFGIDKSRSRHDGYRRIPERLLWILALAGGSAGTLLGMHMFRHKTKKLSFQAVLAVILALQVFLVFSLLTKNPQLSVSGG